MHPGADGLFRRWRLDEVLAGGPDVACYLALAHDLADHDGTPLGPRPVGFALVGGVDAPPAHMLEFFVVRSVRRRGVGYDLARRVLDHHPGPWQIAFQEENPGAARFWRRLVADVAGEGGWTQQSRPVPAKPTLPPDTWLSLTVPGRPTTPR